MLLKCGVGEDSWKSLGLQGDQTISPKGNQSWIFIGGTDAEAPILWPLAAKSWLIRKDPDAGKEWRQEKNGVTEDKMVRFHHRFNGHEFEQALGVGEGQGSLLCCSLWDFAKSQTQLSNWTATTKRHVGPEKKVQCPDLVSDHEADNEVRRMSEAKARAAFYGGSTRLRLRAWLAERTEDAREYFQKCYGGNAPVE